MTLDDGVMRSPKCREIISFVFTCINNIIIIISVTKRDIHCMSDLMKTLQLYNNDD